MWEWKRQRQSVVVLVCAFVAMATCAQVAGATAARYAPKGAKPAAHPFSGVAGPYSSVTTSPNLNCSVLGPSATSEIFDDTACGTFIAVNGTLYGPGVVPAMPTPPGGYTPVSQSTHGAGTPADPQVTTTVVSVGATGLSITQTDTWSGGADLQTSDTVTNTTDGSQSIQLYRALDCFAGGDDTGYGQLFASWLPSGAVGCQDVNPVDGPGAQVLTWIPVTSGSTAVEDAYLTIWNDVDAQAPLPNTCQCGSDIDNGMSVSWSRSIGAGSSTVVSSRLDLIPTQLTLTTKTLTDPVNQTQKGSTGTGEADWTITVTNAGPTPMLSPSIGIDHPSAGSIDLAATATRGSSCSAAGPGYVCALDDLAPGESVDLPVVVDTGGTVPLDGGPISISLAATPRNEGTAVALTDSFQVFAPQPGLVAGYIVAGKTLQLKPDPTPPVNQTFFAVGIGVKPPKKVFATQPSLAELIADPTMRAAAATVAGTGFSGTLQAIAPTTDTKVCGGFECKGALASISPINTSTDPKHPAIIKLTWGAALGSFAGTTLYLREPSDPPGSPGRKVPVCVKVKGFLVSPAPGVPAAPCLAKPLKISSKGAFDQIDALAGDPTFGRH